MRYSGSERVPSIQLADGLDYHLLAHPYHTGHLPLCTMDRLLYLLKSTTPSFFFSCMCSKHWPEKPPFYHFGFEIHCVAEVVRCGLSRRFIQCHSSERCLIDFFTLSLTLFAVNVASTNLPFSTSVLVRFQIEASTFVRCRYVFCFIRRTSAIIS